MEIGKAVRSVRIVISSITYEGILRNREELIEKLKKSGCELFVITPPDNEKAADKTNDNFVFIPIKIEAHGKDPLKDIRIYKEYLRLYREIKPDIVLTYTIKPNVYSGLACEKLGIPYIATINGIGDAVFNKGPLRTLTLMLLKAGLKKADSVFFQNSRNRELFISRGTIREEQAVLVPGSGINTALHPYEAYPVDEEYPTFAFIGRISRDKGINELIAAGRKLHSEGKRFMIKLIGSCPDRYRELVESAEKEGFLRYCGRLSPQEIHPHIKESSAVILPSYHEGIPNVLLEGGAAGRPILTTFAEGCEDTFEDGVSGIGFEAMDTDSLADAMERFMAMFPEERKIMGVAAHDKVISEFDRELVNAVYIKKINELARKKIK